MTTPWDSDINAMTLSDVEKNGLQVFRNYSSAFEKRRADQFAEQANKRPVDLSELGKLFELLITEEIRTLPVIACAFADDQLQAMFRREIPAEVPGGQNELLTGFGPLSRLSQRIQIAFAFGWLSPDLLDELNHLRKIRNDISHKWDIALLESKLLQLIRDKQHPIEEALGDGVSLPEKFYEELNQFQRFRTRLLWLMGRLVYECQFWVPALKDRHKPTSVLYGKGAPDLLGQVASLCVDYTRMVIRKKNEI